MGDYGMKVSRAGFPVNTAADNQLLFSSTFYTMDIVQAGSLSAGQSFAHNLGYSPAFFFNHTYTVTRPGTQSSYGITEFQGGLGSDGTNLTLPNGNAAVSYYLYSRDLRTTYTAANINTTPATQSTPNQDYGFKVSQDSINVGTAPLAQLTTFSGLSLAGQPVRNQLVHQSGFMDGLANNGTLTVSHNLGYTPMFYCYRRDSNTNGQYILWFVDYNVSLSGITFLFTARINSSNLVIVNNEGHSIDIAYIIFKDPF